MQERSVIDSRGGDVIATSTSDLALQPTRALVDHVRAITRTALDDNVLEVAKHGLRDWVSVATAGACEPVARAVREDAASAGGLAQSSVFGTAGKLPAREAALCNGVSAHALDFDDVLESMLGHPTAPILSAAFAVGEACEVSGAELITAYVAGVEAASLVGRMVEPGHHERGWHTTGTIGTFGAAAAVAHLLRLSREQWQHALGLAGAQAAGLKAGFGTMAKPFHAGHAATSGVRAAMLAKRGVTAAADVLEAPRGFAELTTDTTDFENWLEDRDVTFEIEELLFKQHASCYLTHSLIEGLAEIRATMNGHTEAVNYIGIRVSPVHLTTCGLDTFDTDLEGKFSMRYLAGLALVAGRADEAYFGERWRTDPEIVRLSKVVDIIVDNDAAQMANAVEVRTSTDSYRALVDIGTPARTSEALVRQGNKLHEKFDSLVIPIVGAQKSAELSEQIDHIESLPNIAEFFGSSAR